MKNPSSRKILWGAGIALAATVTGAAIISTGPTHDAKANETVMAAPQGVPVSVATVEQREVATWDEFSGRLEAIERVEVRSRVAGAVQAVHFREGGLVKQGDLLITIDPAPYAAEVARYEAQVAAAQARLSFTRREHDRGQQLAGSGTISQRELDQRGNAFYEADANLRAAQAALESSRLNLGYTKVRAPVGGRVGKQEITVGNLVAAGPGAPVLTTLLSVSPIYASFDADEHVVMRALNSLPSGSNARTQVERIPVRMEGASQAVQGHLQMIDNAVDARSGTVRVRAVFDNADGSLMPGQFARLRMGQVTPEPAMVINERAVGTDQDKKFVMVVGDDNKAAYREVMLGASADGLRVVTQGLRPGERIVVNGLQRVRPGALLAPENVAMDAKSAKSEVAQR